MAHARQTIREAVATTLTGLSTTASRVYQTRFHRLAQTDLPCLLIYTLAETVERSAMTDGKSLVRNLSLRVEGVAEATSNLDDTLDNIGAEVEAALNETSPASVEELVLQNVEINISTEGEKPTGMIAMDYLITYRQTSGTPSEIL
jgi:hypothetical protein